MHAVYATVTPLADGGTRLPPQEPATVYRGKPRRFQRSTTRKKIAHDRFHGQPESTPMADNLSPATPMEEPSVPPFVPVARAGDIPAGEGRTFEVSGRLVAVFFDGERYSAIDDLCPHMGASLGSGPFIDGVVTCPWHAWRFRVSDGAWCDNAKLRVDVFDVRVAEGRIEVRVPPAPPIELPNAPG
jgi:nitrite reductase (NADH) small subunit